MAQYTNLSPWFRTTISRNTLDVLTIRPVSSEADDFLYTIEPQYTYRPDLLAHETYYKILYLILFQELKFLFQRIQVLEKF